MSGLDDLLACERCTVIVDSFGDLQEAADGALVCEPCLDVALATAKGVELAAARRCPLCRGQGVIGATCTFTRGVEEIRCTRCGGSGALPVPA